MESALFTLLQTVPGIRKQIGTRIYPIERPQGSKLPAITYRRAGGIRDYDMDGATGLVESRFFIWFYGAKTRTASAYKVAKGLRDLAVAYLTQRPGFTDKIGTTEIQSAIINDEDDRREESATGSGIVRVQLDVTFWHRNLEG